VESEEKKKHVIIYVFYHQSLVINVFVYGGHNREESFFAPLPSIDLNEVYRGSLYELKYGLDEHFVFGKLPTDIKIKQSLDTRERLICTCDTGKRLIFDLRMVEGRLKHYYSSDINAG